MNNIQTIKPLHYRTIWLSDIHLGYKGCKAEYLLDFLKSTRCDTLYLVGDIIDLWSMKRTMYWPQLHNNIVRTILGKAKQGTRIIYIPGNHDEQLREYAGLAFGNLEIHSEYVHTSPSGKRLLILHGDDYDAIMQCGDIKDYFGNLGYDFLLFCNRMVSRLRRHFGFHYWSLSSFIKHKVKNAMRHIHRYEEVAAYDAAKRDFHGVICGHIHHAEIREFGDILYCNTGDWVENCTALVESREGRLELLHWTERQATLRAKQTDMQHKPSAAA